MALWAFLIGLVVDLIPVFAPPAWSVLGLVIIAGTLFIDRQKLMENKKLKVHFKIFKT